MYTKLNFVLLVITISFTQVRIIGGENCKPAKNTTNPLQALKKCLFKGYNPKAVPLQKNEKSINVDTAFILEDAFFSDMSGEATLFLIMTMNWTDPFLKWNPSDFGNLSHIILTQPEAVKIWSPSFSSAYTYRFGGRKNTDNLFQVSKLEVTSAGKVAFSDLVSMNSICDGDLTEFPFDKYECGSIIMSDNFENEVIFRLLNAQGSSVNTTYLNMSLITRHQLEITNSKILVDVSKRGLNEPGREMSITLISLTIDISRKTGTHILVFHLPAIGLSLLLLLPLWIAPDSLTRYLYPLIVMFGSIFQIDAIATLMKMPSHYYSHPTHLVSFYRDLMMLSLLILLESLISALLWKRKSLHVSLQSLYTRTSTAPVLQHLVEYTLFEAAPPKAVQGQKQEECPDECVGPTLLCFAKLIDRIIFLCLSLILLILYWKLVP